MREHVNEWVAGMNINRYMATLYYVTLGFFIMIVTFRHDSYSVAKRVCVCERVCEREREGGRERERDKHYIRWKGANGKVMLY